MELILKMAKTNYKDFRNIMVDIREMIRERVSNNIIEYFDKYITDITKNANDVLKQVLMEDDIVAEDVYVFSEEDVSNGIEREVKRYISSFVEMSSDESTAFSTSEEVEKIAIIYIKEVKGIIEHIVHSYLREEIMYYVHLRSDELDDETERRYHEEVATILEKSLEQFTKDSLTEDDIQSIENKYADLVGDLLEKHGQHIVDVAVE